MCNLPNDRDHVGRPLVCAVNNFSYRLLARFVDLWVTERNTARLSGCQGLRSALADQRTFLLRQRSEQVQDERIDVRAEIGDQERHAVSHQTGDEMHVARQAIELRDGDRAALPARFLERCG